MRKRRSAPAPVRTPRGRGRREGKRIFVLDTNVLIHDPTAIFRFDEHDIYLPMAVLEELDASKKGLSEQARNARQASRFLDQLMQGTSKAEIDAGIALPARHSQLAQMEGVSGHLFFQTSSLPDLLPDTLPGNRPDNTILANTLALRNEQPNARVTLVSKDINLRIKAAVLGIHAEDYYNDRTLADIDVLYTGVEELGADFWDTHGEDLQTWREKNRLFLESVGHQRGLLKIVLIVIMVTAAFLMLATLSMMVTEKISDIGILTAMGGTPSGVTLVFLACGLTITLVGVVVGLATGAVTAIYLEEIRQGIRWAFGIDLFPLDVYNLDRVPCLIDPLWLLQVAGMAFATGFVVSAIPALRAARHDPLVSLRGV